MQSIRNGLVFIAVFIILATSCSKVEDTVIHHPKDPNATYFSMAIGNYWIYHEFTLEPGGEVPTGKIDSTYIEKDTLINGNLYFVYKSSLSLQWEMIMRDSSSYLVNYLGEIFFHAKSIGDTIFQEVKLNPLGDTIFAQYRIMHNGPDQIQLSAGVFSVLDATNIQLFPKAVSSPKERIMNNFYAEGVGLVFRNYFLFGKQHHLKLSRYHIEE